MIGAYSMRGKDTQIISYNMFNIWRVLTTVRTTSKRDNIIKADYKWIGWEVVDWIDLAKNRNMYRKQIFIKCNIEKF
jgi:hypothetical protein